MSSRSCGPDARNHGRSQSVTGGPRRLGPAGTQVQVKGLHPGRGKKRGPEQISNILRRDFPGERSSFSGLCADGTDVE